MANLLIKRAANGGGVRFELGGTEIAKCWCSPSPGHGTPGADLKHCVHTGSETSAILCIKSDFVTRMNCVFWINTVFVKLVSCRFVLRVGKGALVFGGC